MKPTHHQWRTSRSLKEKREIQILEFNRRAKSIDDFRHRRVSHSYTVIRIYHVISVTIDISDIFIFNIARHQREIGKSMRFVICVKHRLILYKSVGYVSINSINRISNRRDIRILPVQRFVTFQYFIMCIGKSTFKRYKPIFIKLFIIIQACVNSLIFHFTQICWDFCCTSS